MITLLSLFGLVSMQATYGPALPPAPPTAPEPAIAGDDLVGSEAVLRANGLSDAGLRALRAIPVPSIARGATRAAQCSVERLSERDPLPIADLAAAMEERDATAAAQAQATTRYLVAALGVLQPADRQILLRVLGTGGSAIGGAPPPRPEMTRSGDRRGPGGPGGAGGPGGPGGGAGGPGGGQGGLGGAGGAPRGDRTAGARDRGPPAGAPAMPREASICERMLGD